KSEDISRIDELFWMIIFIHFDSFKDVYTGYTLDLPLARVIERANTAKHKVLFPKLEEIVGCTDREKKQRLVAEYIYILMSTVFDPQGSARYDILCLIVNIIPDLDLLEDRRRNKRDYLPVLGFELYEFKEDGYDCEIWFWPSKKEELVLDAKSSENK
ncbi:MAG: hypothetical protein AAB870_03100, partial [Patescibacteria group bacterium]